MMVFLILAPYAAFAALMLVASSAVSLFAAAAICLMVIAYDVCRGRSVKMLGAGSAVLFAGLGCYITLVDASLGSAAVKLAVDCGVLAIALLSLVTGRPFTQQYAREMVDAETAGLPGFAKANYVITVAWTLAFVLMVMANVLMIYEPGLPFWAGLAIAFAARNSAIFFTSWYRQYHRTRFKAPQLPLGISSGT
jgi:hypothetical protein